jgi:divalent metal cation (Fe/Co/Zn/Cd) transporter
VSGNSTSNFIDNSASEEIQEKIQRGPLAHGLRVSTASIAWTVVSSTAMITIGLFEESLVAVAFGLTGILDAAGSIALVLNFRHVLRHERFSEQHERVAFHIVTIGLGVVALTTLIASTWKLVHGSPSSESVAALVIAGCSVLILTMLGRIKRKVGVDIPSGALRADGVLSYVGAMLGAVTLAGTAAAAVGATYADPIAAGVVAVGALTAALVLHHTSKV